MIFYSTVRTCRPQLSKSINPSEQPGPACSNRSDRSSRLPSEGSPSSSQQIPSSRLEFFYLYFVFIIIILIRYLLDRDQLDAGTVMTILNTVGLVNIFQHDKFFLCRCQTLINAFFIAVPGYCTIFKVPVSRIRIRLVRSGSRNFKVTHKQSEEISYKEVLDWMFSRGQVE